MAQASLDLCARLKAVSHLHIELTRFEYVYARNRGIGAVTPCAVLACMHAAVAPGATAMLA